jgi:hypothetical protein
MIQDLIMPFKIPVCTRNNFFKICGHIMAHRQRAEAKSLSDFTERSAVHLEGNWGVSLGEVRLGHSKTARNKSDKKKRR